MRRRATVTRNYQREQARLRLEMLQRLERAYSTVDENDIGASFRERFAPVGARIITAAQAQAQTLTRAYVRGIAGALILGPSLAGTSKSGTIMLALVGIVPIILAAIKNGTPPAEALVIGAANVSKTADNELTRVIDAEFERQAASGNFAGWIGHTYGSVDDCTGNEGWHELTDPMYRHPSCRCDRELVPFEPAFLG
jgi:hypothetical protein